ncbi:MAG TPA: BT_3928 family protein [Flavisolibacter sp.]|nr:BT_3928 family protein [Flavisolibacter sp.]
MRILIRITQVLVGVLFIISGLVKANDPLGLAYKMQEFFELWSSSLKGAQFFAAGLLIGFFDFWHQHALALAVTMITLEIVTGMALLLGWMRNFILYLLLLLMIFFTFLTGYAYLSGKFTNCGCFGDCLPITPSTSFLKDIALLILILFLLFGRRYLMMVPSRRLANTVLLSGLIISLAFQWYVLHYLPVADCLPFKNGNNIAEQMKPPPGAVPDSIAIRFIYEKGGKRFEFAPDNLPADFETYTYVDRIDKLVRKGNAEPRIKGFALTDTAGNDLTQQVLTEPVAVLAFALDKAGASDWRDAFRKVMTAAKAKNVPVYFATSNPEVFSKYFKEEKIDVPVLSCDFTVIRTAARTNPTLYILHAGTITGKYSYKKLGDAAAGLGK